MHEGWKGIASALLSCIVNTVKPGFHESTALPEPFCSFGSFDLNTIAKDLNAFQTCSATAPICT